MAGLFLVLLFKSSFKILVGGVAELVKAGSATTVKIGEKTAVK